ncbi:MAG: hypothetical protein ACXWB9_01005 [Flavisolibacter sp.]
MRTILLMVALAFLQPLFAQRTVDVTSGDNRLGPSSFFTVNGTPFANDKYVKLVEGTPYFQNDWLTGMVITPSGQEFKNISLKLNLHSGEVLYKDEKGSEMIATTPLKEVVLTDALGNNFRFIHSSSLPQNEANPLKAGWYQWLSSGSAGLYKYYNKQLSESAPYGSATTEQKIKTKEKFFIAYNNAYFEIAKTKEAPSILANKKTELETYLKTENKAGTLDDRLTALVQHYNELFK